MLLTLLLCHFFEATIIELESLVFADNVGMGYVALLLVLTTGLPTTYDHPKSHVLLTPLTTYRTLLGRSLRECSLWEHSLGSKPNIYILPEQR